MSEVGAHAAHLADHPEERQRRPVEELMREWFGNDLSDSYITELSRQVREAAQEEK